MTTAQVSIRNFFIICLLLLSQHSFAQQQGAGQRVNWEQFASNRNLTYGQIITKCDSLFSVSGNMDSTADDDDNPYNNYLRWKRFWEPRVDATTGKLHDLGTGLLGRITSGGSSSSSSFSDCNETSDLQTSLGSIIANGTGWKFIGPQNVTNENLGRPTQISVNPHNPNEVYASSTWGGLWKTNNALAAIPNWTCLTDNNHLIAGIGVIKFAVDYNYPVHHIYIALGYPWYFFYYDNIAYTVGLFCSADDGATFNNIDVSAVIPDFGSDIISDIKLWPGNSASSTTGNYLYAATKYKLLKINIDNVATTIPSSAITSLVDFYPSLSSLPNVSQRFPGLGEIGFIPSHPEYVYFTTLSNVGQYYPMSARLYKTSTDGSYFVDLTEYLHQPQTDIIVDGDCSSQPSTGWGWDNTTIGSNHGWQWYGGYPLPAPNFNMQYTPNPDFNSACISINLNESYLAPTTYTISYALTLPPHSSVAVEFLIFPVPPTARPLPQLLHIMSTDQEHLLHTTQL